MNNRDEDGRKRCWRGEFWSEIDLEGIVGRTKKVQKCVGRFILLEVEMGRM